MKKILKILSFMGLFLLFAMQTFALDANLSVNKNSSNINDLVQLKLEINSSEGGEIKVTEIKGLENFQKVGQSQSQSSSSQIVVINGKTQSKIITTLNLDLQLKPIKNGEFEIGPAILQSGSGIIKTNSVKIKIDGTSIGILNSNLTLGNNGNNKVKQNKILGQTQRSVSTVKNVKINPNVHSEINLEDYKGNNSELYILFGILFLAGIGFYFLLKNNHNILKNKSKIEKSYNIENKKEENKQDFEIKKENIKYPKTDDKNFIKKAEIALRQKLEQKFNLENINSLTFEEIEKEIGDKLDLTKLFAMINKAKYSNIITDYSKILEKIKEI